MRLFNSVQHSPTVQLAAIGMTLALSFGAVLATEKSDQSLNLKDANLTLEESQQQEWTLPNGRTMTRATTTGTVIDANDPKAIETARRHHQEIKGLVGKRKYERLRTFTNESTGRTEYVYRFTLSDGSQHNMNFSLPLEDIATWDEYQRKEHEQSEHDRQQINAAIAAGKYRLINQDVILIHICRDTSSDEEFKVQRVPLRNGESIALYHPEDVTAEEAAMPERRSTWPEHLQAVRTGKLNLLDAETIFTYQYEVTCDDGVKRIFQYGDDDLLKPSKAK